MYNLLDEGTKTLTAVRSVTMYAGTVITNGERTRAIIGTRTDDKGTNPMTMPVGFVFNNAYRVGNYNPKVTLAFDAVEHPDGVTVNYAGKLDWVKA